MDTILPKINFNNDKQNNEYVLDIDESVIETSDVIDESVIETSDVIDESVIETSDVIDESVIETSDVIDESVIETSDVIDESDMETSDVIGAYIKEMLDEIIDDIVTSDDKYLQESEINDIIEEVVRSMCLVICGDASQPEDAPSTEFSAISTVESTATSEGGPQQDVNEERTPAKGATPVQSAPRRLNPFSVTWKFVKRVVRGICCCRGSRS
ncbi:unnamed protein product [Macrosiphum euphorbiae]|uniref:Uncharacterized protein n=1 Tax=Macrosiphum euphorbiae TaxID=13131 RepID=A0AAV0WYP4_9HEMI|nr:unnamed protein product [Macrosiphum euphorbiae]